MLVRTTVVPVRRVGKDPQRLLLLRFTEIRDDKFQFGRVPVS